MDFKKELEIAWKQVEYAFERNNVPVPNILKISFSGRLTSSMGYTYIQYSPYFPCLDLILAEIKLSKKLWERATPAQRKSTVIHEACHVIYAVLEPDLFKITKGGHGDKWKEFMENTGEKPEVCHNVPTDRIKRRQQRFTYCCACTEHKITKTKVNKIKRGAIYRCVKCKQEIVPKTSCSSA